MLTKNQYLDLIGITQWQLRENLAPMVLIPSHIAPASQWLFILEKQEATQDLPLLHAILGAIHQTSQTVSIAYFDELSTSSPLPVLSKLRYIVVMGEYAAQQFQAQHLFAKDIPVIISDNLTTLADNPTSKRALWQQLKRYPI